MSSPQYIETGVSAGEIYRLIPLVMSEIGAVQKNRKNEKQNYQFRGIEDFYDASHPAFAKHGMFCAPEVLDREEKSYEKKGDYDKVTLWRHVTLRVRHRFFAGDGSFVDVTTIGEGLDNSDKASNKAMSGAMKYALIELFQIPTKDVEDSDSTTPEVVRTSAPLQVSSPRTQRAPDNSSVKGKTEPAKAAEPEGGSLEPPDGNYMPALADAVAKTATMPDAFDSLVKEKNPAACITLPEQRRVHRAFKDAVPLALGLKDSQKDAILQEWLKHRGFAVAGRGSTTVIPKVGFEEFVMDVITYAESLK